jgi:uncharacterized protein (DUF58 family)
VIGKGKIGKSKVRPGGARSTTKPPRGARLSRLPRPSLRRPRFLPALPPWLVSFVRTLSSRGRVVLVLGFGLLVTAFATGQQILLRLGVLLFSTPLVCLLVLSRAKNKLHCTRVLTPARVSVGDPVRVLVRVFNDATSPSSVLLAEDQMPPGLDAQPRFVLDRIGAAGDRAITYRTRGRVRGRYTVGPLRVRTADPFGMCERDLSLEGTDHLVVIPVVEPLPVLPLNDQSPGSSDNRPSSLATGGDDDIRTREYRHGDPINRIHWRSTARRGELMVRQEESPRQSRATVLLDVRAGAHRGPGPESSLEWAVSACASMSAHLAQRGFAVQMLIDRPVALRACVPAVVPAGAGQEGPLLDALAVLETGRSPLPDVTKELQRPGMSTNVLVAILGELSAEDAEDLARRRPPGCTAIAFLLRTATWDRQGRGRGTGGGTDRSAVLRNAGWHTVSVEHGDSVVGAWRSALGGSGAGGASDADKAAAYGTGRTPDAARATAAATADGAA